MNTTLRLLLLVLALGSFLIGTLPMVEPYRIRLTNAGLAFLTASMITW